MTLAPTRRSALGLLGALATPSMAAAAAPPDLILHNALVWTGDPLVPEAQAVAIRRGRITAVGDSPSLLALRGRDTRLLDAGGRRAIPGVNDAHDHGGSASPGVDVKTTPPAEADPPLEVLVSAVARAAKGAPKGTWLFANAGPKVMGDPVGSLAALDGVSGDHPLIAMAWWGHGVLLNRAAQRWAGVNDSTADPAGGWLNRDAQGRFTGRLDEYAGAGVWRRLSAVTPHAAHVQAFKAYAAQRLAQGVTSVQIMTTSQPPIDLARTAVDAKTGLDVRLIQYMLPQLDGLIPLKARVLDDRVRIDGVKYVLDGTPIEQFALQTEDYPGRPGWRGRLDFDPGFISARLREALASDQQLCLHVVGRATPAVVLDLMDALAPASAWAPRRVRFEHADGVAGDALARARELGVVIAQPRPTAPYRSWISAGIPVAYGSDIGFAPWTMFAAMTAQTNPRSITRPEALKVLTSASAWAERTEKRKGRIAAGYTADLAVLSQDVLSASVRDPGGGGGGGGRRRPACSRSPAGGWSILREGGAP